MVTRGLFIATLSTFNQRNRCALSTLQVNFLEDSLRSEDADKGDMSARYRGVRKPQTTFKGSLLHVR